jgi:protein tyrosine phosphatase
MRSVFYGNSISNPDHFSLPSVVRLVSDMLSYHRQQRSLGHPVLAHCLGGSGRTALVLVLAAAIAEIDIGQLAEEGKDIVPDVVEIAALVCKQRKVKKSMYSNIWKTFVLKNIFFLFTFFKICWSFRSVQIYGLIFEN